MFLSLVLVLACSTPSEAPPAAEVAPPAGASVATPGPLPVHDHRALHGGQVSMYQDHHVEYVGHDGEYRFWVTSATREPITTGLAGTVKDGDTVLPLVADNTTGLLSARGPGAGTRPVLVEVTADGRTFSLGFNPSATAVTTATGGATDAVAPADHAGHANHGAAEAHGH